MQRALDQIDSGLTTQDVLNRLVSLEFQLWNINDWQAACITQMCNLPQFKILSVLYLAGDGMDEWLKPLMIAIHGFAKREDCRIIDLFGRPGWERTFKNLGGFKAYTVMRFETDGWKFPENDRQ